MDWESRDLPNTFKRFRGHAYFMFGRPLEKKFEEAKCKYHMLQIGEKADTHSRLGMLRKKRKKTYNELWRILQPTVNMSNMIYSRYKLNSRIQQEGDPFELLVKDWVCLDATVEDMIRKPYWVRAAKFRNLFSCIFLPLNTHL